MIGGLDAVCTTGLAPEAPAGRGLTDPDAACGAILGVAAGVGACGRAEVMSKGRKMAGRKT